MKARALVCAVLGSLAAAAAAAQPLFFGEADRVGTIDPTTGTATAFPAFGLGGFVTAMAFDGGTLYAYVAGSGVGTVDTTTGALSLFAPSPAMPAPGSAIESLAFGAGQLFFGGPDLVGTVDTTTGSYAGFPAFGLGGFITAMAFDAGSGTLYAYVAGAGVGTVDTVTGALNLFAPSPAMPAPGSGIESLAFLGGQLFFGGPDLVGIVDTTTGVYSGFPAFGLGGFVTAMAGDAATGTLYAHVAGSGVGTVDTGTGALTLLTPAPPFPGTACCIESLAFLEPPSAPPVALCQDVTVDTGSEDCSAVASIDAGSFDPDGGAVSLAQDPPGPYGLGDTLVTLTVTDQDGDTGSCQATVTVIDSAAPIVDCGAPPTITPPMAPISFTASATDNCGVASVVVAGFDCFAINGAGKRVDKRKSCVVSFAGDTLTILDSGGVGTTVTWPVTATDTGGNALSRTCSVTVAKPGGGPPP